VRGQILIEPSSDFKARIIADYDSMDEICCGVVNLQASQATQAIRAIGGNVNNANDIYGGVVYNNIDSSNDISNWGISGQFDWNISDDVTLTSITAYRNNKAITAQDPDFTSADLINPISANIDLDTFTQEMRLTAQIGDSINLLVGGFYIRENVEQDGTVLWGADARNYANLLIQSLSGGALSLFGTPPGPPVPLEYYFGALEGNPGKYAGEFFKEGSGFRDSYGLDSEAYSFFGQVDFDITDRLTLTLGGNYTKDTKDFRASIDSTDTFAKIDFNNPAYAPFRQQLLYQGGLSQQVGTALGLGRGATATEIGQFAVAQPVAYGQINTAVGAYAVANQNNPAVNPLNGLKQVQFLPPFLAVPNAVESGHVSDDDFSHTVRLAYDVTDDVNVYASWATGFKAASVNLSRDSRPFASDAAALGAAGLLQVNQSYGSRYAEPEESTVYEFGIKAKFGGSSANLAVFKQEIEGFQSNVFTGTGFALANAGKQSTFGVEFEGTAQVTNGLSLNVGVTYLDPVFDDFQFSTIGDLSGTRPAGIPEWTAVVGGQYEYEMGSGDRVILNASYHYESEVQIVEGLAAFLPGGQDAAIAAAAPFTREVNDLSASITYAMENGLEFSVWGRNLLDDRYLLQIFDSVAQPQSISGYTNQPLTWGGAIRFKW